MDEQTIPIKLTLPAACTPGTRHGRDFRPPASAAHMPSSGWTCRRKEQSGRRGCICVCVCLSNSAVGRRRSDAWQHLVATERLGRCHRGRRSYSVGATPRAPALRAWGQHRTYPTERYGEFEGFPPRNRRPACAPHKMIEGVLRPGATGEAAITARFPQCAHAERSRDGRRGVKREGANLSTRPAALMPSDRWGRGLSVRPHYFVPRCSAGAANSPRLLVDDSNRPASPHSRSGRRLWAAAPPLPAVDLKFCSAACSRGQCLCAMRRWKCKACNAPSCPRRLHNGHGPRCL